MPGLSPWVDGVPLRTICSFSDLSWTTRWPYGDWEASWRVHVPAGFRHRNIRQGVEVTIPFGGKSLWTGDLEKPDWSTGQMTAKGRIRQGENYRALRWDSDLLMFMPTWDVQVAITEARSGGHGRPALNWKVGTLPSGALSPERNTEPISILDLLDLARDHGDGTPYMGPNGRLQLLADPTTVTWQVFPKVVDVGDSGGTDRATAIYMMYLPTDTATDWDATLSYDAGQFVRHVDYRWEALESIPAGGAEPGTDNAKWKRHQAIADVWSTEFPSDTRFTPYRELSVDARGLGELAVGESDVIAQRALDEHLAPAYTTDIQATPLTVTGPQLQPVAPILLRAGTLGRIHGANHPRLGSRRIDVIAGEVAVHNAETSRPTAVIKPYAKEPSSYMEVMEATLTAARKAAS